MKGPATIINTNIQKTAKRPEPGTWEAPPDMGKRFLAARVGLLSTGTECPGSLQALSPSMELLKSYPDANTRNSRGLCFTGRLEQMTSSGPF